MFKTILCSAMMISMIALHAHGDRSTKAEEQVNKVNALLSDSALLINSASNDIAFDLLEIATEHMNKAQEILDKDDYREFKHLRKLVMSSAALLMRALDEDDIKVLDIEFIAKSFYEEQMEITVEKEFLAENVVFGSRYGGNELAEQIFNEAHTLCEVSKKHAEDSEYFKAYTSTIRSGQLYCESRKVAKKS